MQIVCFFCFFASPSCSFDSLSISNVCAVYLFDDSVCVYALDKLRNREGINHCHLAAQRVAHAARARVPCTSCKPLLLSLTSMNFKLFQYINLRQIERVGEKRAGSVVGDDDDKHFCAFAI